MSEPKLTLVVAIAALVVAACQPATPTPATGPAAVATTRKVGAICQAIAGWQKEFGKAPPDTTTLSELIRRKPKTPEFRFRDGYGRPFVLLDADGVLVGAYSKGANGYDEGGGGDDVACRVD